LANSHLYIKAKITAADAAISRLMQKSTCK